MQLTDCYHIISFLLANGIRHKIKDPKKGDFAYIPQGFDHSPEHTLVYSRQTRAPNSKELENIKEALYLVLRQLTRKSSHILIQDIEVGPTKVTPTTSSIYVMFTWKSALVADLGRLSKQQEAVSVWWLKEISRHRDTDKQLLDDLKKPDKKETWIQPSILPQ